jgi:hypothetical protein
MHHSKDLEEIDSGLETIYEHLFLTNGGCEACKEHLDSLRGFFQRIFTVY